MKTKVWLGELLGHWKELNLRGEKQYSTMAVESSRFFFCVMLPAFFTVFDHQRASAIEVWGFDWLVLLVGLVG